MLGIRKFAVMAINPGTDSMTRSVISGLGTTFIEIVYIAGAVILGINLLKRESFYELIKNFGEGDKTNSQVANIIGIIVYGVVVFLTLPLVKTVGLKLFGG